MNKRKSIHDVAKHAGVSSTTVSRVLNNRGYISETTRQKVNESIKALAYVPNELARSFTTNITKFIGLIIPTTANPFFGELTYFIEKELSQQGYKLFLCNSINEIKNEKKYITMLQENQVDGIIVGTHNLDVSDYDNLPLKVVSIDRHINDNITIIHADNYKGGQLATEYLIDGGCKDILCISGDPKIENPANLRKEAYKDSLKKCNLSTNIFEIPFALSYDEKIKKIDQLFNNGNLSYDGIFTGDDVIALMIFAAANKYGIKVPESLRVVGFDGSELIQKTSPHLSTVKQPIELLAKTAVETLLLKISSDTHPDNIVLPVQLIKSLT